MVLPGHSLADGALHQTRQRGQHVDGRIDLTVVQLTVDVDLALRNVSSEIGDGVSDICREKTRTKQPKSFSMSIQATEEGGEGKGGGEGGWRKKPK